MHHLMLMRRLEVLIKGHRIRVDDEGSAQRDIESLLQANAYDFRAECKLDAKSRVDFMVSAVALEVKVGRRWRPLEVMQQLERYAAHPDVLGVMLVTASPWMWTHHELHGKPAMAVDLSRGWL